jgi:hypothetical protein
LIALIFTWQSINATTDATNRQLQVAGQGQVTDRYSAAITNLDSSSVDVRLGGIYALQRIMQDSPLDQPAVVTGSARRPSRGGRREPAGDLNAVEVREWARAQGIEVKDHGRVPADVIVKFRAATS